MAIPTWKIQSILQRPIS